MKQIHSEILKLEAERAIHQVCLKESIKREKKKLHREYIAANKRKLVWMDIAFICIIIFNLGAMVLTNLLVVKAEPANDFVEANPSQCRWNGFSCAEENLGKKIIFSLMKQSMIWSIFTVGYLYQRAKVYTDEGYYFLLWIVLFYFWMTNIDFIHDLGLYLGKVVFGV